MPYGLFDFEDTIEPMGLSPQAPDFVPAQKIPATTPPNTGLVTRAFPENPPQQMMTQAIPENPPSGNPYTLALGESGVVTDACIPSEGCNPNPVTARIPENAPVTKMAYGENPVTPNPINYTLKHPENPVTPDPIMTFYRSPENPVTPTPPSGQCPTGYQPASQSSSAPVKVKPPSYGFLPSFQPNNNPYGLTAGQQIVGASTGKPFNVNQAGNVWTQIASAR